MNLVKAFRELNKDDVAIAGGKGASLGEMTQAGIPVPEGFVVLSEAFERFVEETDLNVEIDAALDSVNHEEMHTVEKASEKIQALILAQGMPKDIGSKILGLYSELKLGLVAVRSSATAEDSSVAAWAGQLDSFLNTTKGNLLENVKKCWASLFTPRAIFYRFEKKLHKQKISVAVVVQKMVDSKEAGIAFSVHPVTEDRNQIIIEAGFGLGEAIVQGAITPDSYVVDKQDWHIIDVNVNEQTRGLFKKSDRGGGNEWKNLRDKGKKQVLTEKEILGLSKLIVRIEEHYGFPVDIEWAKEKSKFYIVQSRPITTLSPKEESSRKKIKLIELMHSDFPLMMADLTDYGESLEDVPWTKERFTIKPYCAFVRKNGQLWYYYDPEGIKWNKEQAGKFDPKVMIKESLKGFKSVKDIVLKEKALGLKEFKEFIESMKKVFTWWVCMWWMIEDYDEKGKDLNDIIKVRKKTEYLAPGTVAVMRKSAAKIHPSKKKYVDVLTLDEVISGNLPGDEVLEERLREVAFTQGKGYSSFEDIKKEYGVYLEEDKLGYYGNKLTGQVAYGGKVKGKVRIIGSRSEVKNLKKGEILVAGTTTPDFLPAMKLAGAIISEHGGAISHAAITSREIKKPCIVGVKNAKKVLKDGDLVEVDAYKGVVKILGSKSKKASDYIRMSEDS